MSRPLGVTVLAILSLIGACFFTLFGILALVGGAVAAFASMPLLATLSGASAALAAAFCFVAAALNVWIGVGLLRLRNSARSLTLVFVGLSLVASLFGLASALLHFDMPTALLRLIIGGIDLWIVRYLLKPEIKAAFSGAGF
jgi:hypothetical protein